MYATGMFLRARGCLLGATPRGQPWTSAVTLPHGRNGLSARRMAVLYTFRESSPCRQVHREFLRSALLDLTPIIPATACHQRNYVERYSRSTVVFGIGGRDVLNSAPSFCNSTLASGYAILAAVSSSGKSCLNRLKAVLPPNISCKSFQSLKSAKIERYGMILEAVVVVISQHDLRRPKRALFWMRCEPNIKLLDRGSFDIASHTFQRTGTNQSKVTPRKPCYLLLKTRYIAS